MTAANSSASRPYHLLMSCCGAFAALTFGLMSVLVTLDVVLRNLNINFIPASVEITEYMLMIATFIAAPWLLYQGGHIRIDVVVNKLPATTQRLLSIVCNQDSHKQGSLVFKELIFPEWWLSLPLLIGAALLTLEFARRLRLNFTQGAV